MIDAGRKALRVAGMLVVALLMAGCAGSAATPKPTVAFDPSSDAHVAVQSAMSASRSDALRVMLVFGADWCTDSRVFASDLDSREAASLVAKFHVVRIDVGRADHNMDIDDQYGDPINAGIPAVVVLDSTGTVVADTSDGSLASARSLSLAAVLAKIQSWVG